MACGYHVATGRHAAVYMQNSGLGNAVNPLLSLADADVYRIPLLLVIGWRGEPGVADEPQHAAQGRLPIPRLEVMGIRHEVLEPAGRWERQLAGCVGHMDATGRPAALVVRKGAFEPHKAAPVPGALPLRREEALEAILEGIGPDALVVSTTGKASREIFEIRERRGEGHARDFLTVGSMGHASSIALGMSLGAARDVYCIDGDGAFLMHMGPLAVAAKHARGNLRYVLINNGVHESVGGQPTVAFDMDAAAAWAALGFGPVRAAADRASLALGVEALKGAPRGALAVTVAQGSRDTLGRPTIAPERNKLDMMALIAEGGAAL
jgi:phosphonopyruvate decarboxylase